ncbi:MAG: hypothetical protein AAF846_09710 [Chloroflexota bacterium]
MTLSAKKSLEILRCFLDKIWREQPDQYPDDLPVLLGSMTGFRDIVPPDPAILEDWKEVIEATTITSEQAYEKVKVLLGQHHLYLYTTPETQQIVEQMEVNHDKMWSLWEECVRDNETD